MPGREVSSTAIEPNGGLGRVPATGRVSGTVLEFDEATGHGVVVTASGDRRWFHCASIADGSRSIGLVEVAFSERRGHGGRMEADQLSVR